MPMLKLPLTHRALIACALALGLAVVCNDARAYDLSRAYETNADITERGFVVGNLGLWIPGAGSFKEFHQLSLDLGGEVGFRFASIRGDHNLYVVGGFNVSPQKLDPYYTLGASRDTLMMLGYVGVRYLPALLCVGDGLGCPFVELRFGFLWEDTDADLIEHYGPDGTFTVLPGVGYRFRFGGSFQVGARADFSFTEDYDDYDLGWLNLTTFIGFGW